MGPALNNRLFLFVTQGHAGAHLLVFAPLGLAVGIALARWSDRIIRRESGSTRELSFRGQSSIALAAMVFFPALTIAVGLWHIHFFPDAASIDWAQWRVPYQFALVCLLLVATAVDLELYLIPDCITVTGMVIGVVGGTAIGHTHLVPVWVDWNQVHPLTGTYIPEWIKTHPVLHGAAYSLTGLIAGGGLTWLARLISQGVLGVEALGFGDVTLMAMIGSFLGWQPVLFVFMLAPACGLVVALASKLLHGRRAVPYGPYLSIATIIVLFAWRTLWEPTREFFGHWPTLIGFAALLMIGLALLLGLLRLYRSIPVTRRSVPGADIGEAAENRTPKPKS